MTHLTAKEIVDLNKEYTFYSWSNQGQVKSDSHGESRRESIFGMRMESAILILHHSWSTRMLATSIRKW